MLVDFDSLGSYLHQERERQQISLLEVAAATKIQLKFLEALEHDAYDQLPAAPFVVGFLRAYAQYIALDPEMVLTAYRSLHQTPEPSDVARQPAPVPTSALHRGQVIRLGVFLAVFGLLTGVAIHEMRRGQQTRTPVASFPIVLPGQEEEATDTSRSAAPVAPRIEPSGAVSAGVPTPPAPAARGEQGPGLTVLRASDAATLSAPPAAPGTSQTRVGGGSESPDTLVLQARAMAETWLQVEIDGGKRQTLRLTSGKNVQWEAHERFRLTVGNVRGTKLVLNGQEIPLQAGRSNVLRDVLLTRALLH